MTFISSCARSHAAPRFVCLKTFAARVFTILYAVAVNIVNLGTFCSKARAYANPAEAGFKSTIFLTQALKGIVWHRVLMGFCVTLFLSKFLLFLYIKGGRFCKYLLTFPTMLALDSENYFALVCLFLSTNHVAQRIKGRA